MQCSRNRNEKKMNPSLETQSDGHRTLAMSLPQRARRAVEDYVGLRPPSPGVQGGSRLGVQGGSRLGVQGGSRFESRGRNRKEIPILCVDQNLNQK